MKTQAIETSFDVVCARSQWRHHRTIDMVLEGFKKSQLLSDQAESVQQILVDEAKGLMEGFLLRQTARSSKPFSTEYFAESWDYLLWSRYKIKCGIDDCFPFEYPEYGTEHLGTPAPEHVRIMEPQEQAHQAVASPSSSPASARPSPNVEVAQEATAQGNLVVRPAREDLPKALQDRVLPLNVRQEIWEKHFPNCKKQEGTEPLQLQIPRSKISSLLVGRIKSDGQVTTREIFDRLRNYLPCGIDVIYQDSSDKRFGFTLLYIGLIPGFKNEPQVRSAIVDLHRAWGILWPWARLVNEGYNIDIAKFAQWHIKNEIEAKQHKAMDMEGDMTEALAFVEKEQIRRDQSVA